MNHHSLFNKSWPPSSFHSQSAGHKPLAGGSPQPNVSVSHLVQAVDNLSLTPTLDSSTDALLDHLDRVKTTYKNEEELVNGLRLKVPNIQTSSQFSRYVDAVLEFKNLPGMDGVAHQLIVLATQASQTYPCPQELIDCATRPMALRYPDPYPIDRFLQGHEGTGESLVQQMMKPRHTWGATAIGRSFTSYEPPGLISGLMQLLPRLSAPELVELLNALRTMRYADDKTTDLFAATLARVIGLIDKGPTDQNRPRRIEQVLIHLSPAPTSKRHAVVQQPRFPGIPQELERLTKQLDEALEAIRRGAEPRTAKALAATRFFFSEALALLPHVLNVTDLGLLEAVAQLAPVECASAPQDYLQALNRQKLEWALGLPCAVSAQYPKVHEATNALLLLLVTPKVSLLQFAQSALRPDLLSVDDLRTALDKIPLDQPSPNDQVLLNALNERVQEVLQICGGDEQAHALVLGMIAALKDRPQEHVEQLHSRVLGRLGLAQAAPPLPLTSVTRSLTPVPQTMPPHNATQAMPGAQTTREYLTSLRSSSVNAPRESEELSFIRDVERELFEYTKLSETERGRIALRQRGKDNPNNLFNEKLVSWTPRISTQRDLTTLRKAMDQLPSDWKHDRVIGQLVLRYQMVCRDRQIEATALNAKRVSLNDVTMYLASVLPES
jgi:hypothetical protein